MLTRVWQELEFQHILHCCIDPCLKARINSAVKNIDASMLTRVWQELECQHILHCCIDPCLKARINAAVKNIYASMLTRVWQELGCLIDVCRVTRGAHIEHLYFSNKLVQVFLWLVTIPLR
jgi:hypothetical protein